MKLIIRRLIVPFWLAILLVLCSCGSAASASQVKSGDQAMTLLRDRIQQDHLYQGRYDVKCLTFSLEDQSGNGYIISVRENHTGSCGGDPNVAPLVDTFRVAPDGSLAWLGPDGTYLPYAQARSIIQEH